MNAVLALVLLLAADTYTGAFAKANDAYLAGEYAQAVRGYEELVAEGAKNPVIFFNLGNAYYKQGRLGLAIANFERALHLQPGFEEARDNLAVAVMHTRQKAERPAPPLWEQNLLFWHYDITYRATWWLAAAAWVLFWILLAVRIARPLPYLRGAVVVLGVLALAFGWSAWRKAHPEPMAVAVVDEVPLRYGPGEDEAVVTYGSGAQEDGAAEAALYEGDRLRVERHAGWTRVAAADGRRGWVPEADLAFATPPYGERPQTTNPDRDASNNGEREGEKKYATGSPAT